MHRFGSKAHKDADVGLDQSWLLLVPLCGLEGTSKVYPTNSEGWSDGSSTIRELAHLLLSNSSRGTSKGDATVTDFHSEALPLYDVVVVIQD